MPSIALQHLYISTNYICTHTYAVTCCLLAECDTVQLGLLCWYFHMTLLFGSIAATLYHFSVNTCFYLVVYKCLYFQSSHPDSQWLTGIKSGHFWNKKYTSQSWYSVIQFGVIDFIRMHVFIAGLACRSQEPGIGRNSCFFTCKYLHYSRRVGCRFLQFSTLYFSYLNMSVFI